MTLERPALPMRTLVTLSVYWLGILTIQFGLGSQIVPHMVQDMVGKANAGTGLAVINAVAHADYAQRGPSGELDRLAFRAQRSIAYAMGHLARADGRALAWLIRVATDENAAGTQSFRQLDPARFARLMREGAITGLALSGRPEAARVLAAIVAKPGAEPRLVERAQEALSLHARISSEGPASALDAGFGPER